MKKHFRLLSLLSLLSYLSHIQSRQGIIPMAGLGTRLLPITKEVPKSMIPVIDKPALQLVVEEALRSEITDFCFIVNEDETDTIKQHFSHDFDLEATLKDRKKDHLLNPLNAVIEQAQFAYIPQLEPLGSGHAVLMGESFINPGDSFAVMYPDDIIEGEDTHMARLFELSKQYNASIITVEEITREQASLYAVVTPKEFLSDDVFEVANIVEKPKSTDQDICFSQIGRFVFTYDIFEALKAIGPCDDGEIQLTEAVKYMVRQGKRVLACRLGTKRHDTGNIRSYLKTIVSLGLHHPLYREMVLEIFEQESNIQQNN